MRKNLFLTIFLDSWERCGMAQCCHTMYGINLCMYRILKKILTHKEDFWYPYGFFGLKIRTENFRFPDDEFLYSNFWGVQIFEGSTDFWV